MDVIFEQPFRRIADVVHAGIVERQAAARHLKSLASIGILSGRKIGREKLFIHTRLLELLTHEEHEFEGFRS